MLPDMTEAVARALRSAGRLAAAADSPVVRPADLLAALLEEEEGRPWAVLESARLDVAAFRAGITPPAGKDGVNVIDVLSPESERAFNEARILSRTVTGVPIVAGECLLIALLREDDRLRQALERAGVSNDTLEAEILGPAAEPLAPEQPLALAEMTERVDAARVLDAAANRAREALRVLEDYARFCLDDRYLTEQLKHLRHDLRSALDTLPDELLLQSRDTPGDVGTTIGTEAEQIRNSLREVVQAGCKRLEEALRSLEEFGKLLRGGLGVQIEQLRYRAYTLERALLSGTTARDRLARARIQVLLTGSQCLAALDWTIAEAAAGGADVIQLREKSLSDRDLLARARLVRRVTQQEGVLFVVNDRPDIARLVDADGVHLGQDDLSVREARRIVGPDLLIGVSTHSLPQLRQAILDGAGYVGVGPTFASPTKEFDEFPGLEYLHAASAETTLPAFAIGGISAATLPAAVAAGARRIAVSAAVCRADDPRRAVAELRAILDAAEA